MQIHSFFSSKSGISHLYVILEYVFFFFFKSLHACSAREVTQQAHIRGKEAKPPSHIHPYHTLDEQLHLVVMFA